MTEGYIYIVSNSVGGIKETDYIKEAIFSAKSLRALDSNANITLFTDIEVKDSVFNEVKIVKMSLRCKQKFFLESPYDKTIYIDSDTYINHNISDMFQMLNKYELLGCHDYARKRIFNIPEYMKIPYCFSEINGGILAFKKCHNFNKLIELWNHYYNKYYSIVIWDQPSFRIATWESNINLYILPNEYNRRALATKDKCINCRRSGDPRFGKEHLKTRIYHFHGLEKMNAEEKEKNAQNF
jgi:hypothetical protein